ncbi:MAG: hypothetical protein M3347_11100 [Armatimonadota bacterium]|nr:hypothetical protein [Armatimonadota bacterium]
MTQTMEPVEAVIISGPRKGEIVRLNGDAAEELPNEDISDEEIEMLNAALDQLIAAVDRLNEKVCMAIEAVEKQMGDS